MWVCTIQCHIPIKYVVGDNVVTWKSSRYIKWKMHIIEL